MLNPGASASMICYYTDGFSLTITVPPKRNAKKPRPPSGLLLFHVRASTREMTLRAIDVADVCKWHKADIHFDAEHVCFQG
jgi:hypothetical protein